MPTNPNTARHKAYMREYRKRAEYKVKKKATRESVKPKPAPLPAAVKYIRRPCLGPDDVPAHDYAGGRDHRICPECTALLKQRNLSSRMCTMSCSPLE